MCLTTYGSPSSFLFVSLTHPPFPFHSKLECSSFTQFHEFWTTHHVRMFIYICVCPFIMVLLRYTAVLAASTWRCLTLLDLVHASQWSVSQSVKFSIKEREQASQQANSQCSNSSRGQQLLQCLRHKHRQHIILSESSLNQKVVQSPRIELFCTTISENFPRLTPSFL